MTTDLFPDQNVYHKADIARVQLSNQLPVWVSTAVSVVKSAGTSDSDYWLQKHGRRRVAVFVPRMKPTALSTPAEDISATLGQRRAKELFLLTGGTGGIGSALVDWLIDEQDVDPCNVALLSRRSFEHPRGVTVIKVDLTDPGAILQCAELSAIEAVGGVFHLAGSLDDGILTSITKDRMEQVLRPKVQGVISLLNLIKERDWDPEFVLNFSSTSSLLGYPGQSSYCAANSFLDALCTWGFEQYESPVITINWGPWAEVGMTKNSSKALDMSIKGGDMPLSSKDAFQALSWITSGQIEGRHIAVCDVQWNKSIWNQSPLLAELRVPDGTPNCTDETILSRSTESTNDDTELNFDSTVRGEVEKLLRSQISAWHPNEALMDLGLDSLDLVRLRGAFQKQFQQSSPLSVFMQPHKKLANLLNDLVLILSDDP